MGTLARAVGDEIGDSVLYHSLPEFAKLKEVLLKEVLARLPEIAPTSQNGISRPRHSNPSVVRDPGGIHKALSSRLNDKTSRAIAVNRRSRALSELWKPLGGAVLYLQTGRRLEAGIPERLDDHRQRTTWTRKTIRPISASSQQWKTNFP